MENEELILAELKTLSRNLNTELAEIKNHLVKLNGTVSDNKMRSIRNEVSIRYICSFGGAIAAIIIGLLIKLVL